MRLVIYTVFFPPVVIFDFLYPSPGSFTEMKMLFGLLAFSYAVGVVPAWLTATFDWLLSGMPVYLRIVPTMIFAATAALMTAHQGLGLKGEAHYYGLMGAAPAAVCCLLSEWWSRIVRVRASKAPKRL